MEQAASSSSSVGFLSPKMGAMGVVCLAELPDQVDYLRTGSVFQNRVMNLWNKHIMQCNALIGSMSLFARV